MAKNTKPLPKWMLKSSSEKKEKSQVKESGAETPKVGLRKTVYFLSEKELLDTAKEILVQAGRGDRISDLEQQKNEKGKKRKLDISSKDRSSDPNTSSSSPYKLDTDSPDLFSELSAGSDDNQNITCDQNTTCDQDITCDRNIICDRKTRSLKSTGKLQNLNKEQKIVITSVDNVKKQKPDLSILDEIFS